MPRSIFGGNRWNSNSVRFLILLCILILSISSSLFVFFGHRFLYHRTNRSIFSRQNSKFESCRQYWTRNFGDIRHCLQKLSTLHSPQDIEKCIGAKFEFEFANGYFLKPKAEDQAGVFVRLGFGGNSNFEFENQLQRTYSNFSFFASGDLSKIDRSQFPGRLYNFSNIQKSGNFEFGATDRFGRKKARSPKFDESTGSIELIDLLTRVIGKYAIDYLLITDRSMASSILDDLSKNGVIERYGIAVCQIWITLTDWVSKEKSIRDSSDQQVIDFLRKSIDRWLPLKIRREDDERLERRVLSVFMVNTASLYCTHKYFSRC